MVNYIAIAIPVFFALIGLEYAVARWQGKRVYRFHDAVTDLSCGIGQQVTGLFMKALLFAYLSNSIGRVTRVIHPHIQQGRRKIMTTTLQRETPRQEAARQQFVLPAVNIREEKEAYVLEADMPGVNKDTLEITLEGSELTLIGRRVPQPVVGAVLLREQRQADYKTDC